LAAALFPVVAAIPVFGKTVVFIVFAAFLALLVVLRHRANIERIFSGTESKLGAKKAIKNAQ
jgi:acyl phosphate:glycerol-3-phosphate acyltransferase